MDLGGDRGDDEKQAGTILWMWLGRSAEGFKVRVAEVAQLVKVLTDSSSESSIQQKAGHGAMHLKSQHWGAERGASLGPLASQSSQISEFQVQ